MHILISILIYFIIYINKYDIVTYLLTNSYSYRPSKSTLLNQIEMWRQLTT